SIILFVVFSLILSSIFLLINKNKINIKYELNMIANSPSMIINCGSDFYCNSNYINGTETYAKVALLTKINTTGEKNFISINNEIVNKKYKPALIMALTLIIAVIFSSSYHIIKRSILEYKNKLNRSFY
ncbi:hypothetical protein NDJ44_21630, partial [Escherichia coli]|uniref:GNVR domain-containing protein n=1 Tax=Escherichia coli TaxID=562 RepID=UPI002673749C